VSTPATLVLVPRMSAWSVRTLEATLTPLVVASWLPAAAGKRPLSELLLGVTT
jgi:hypothetical protein